MNESTRRKINLNFDNKPTINHILNFKFALPYIKNKQVLDIGCWTGQFEKLALSYTKSITGIDPGTEAIKIARKNVPRANFKKGDALNLSFEDNKFDRVVLMDVLEHIPKNTESKCLEEIYRVLKLNGLLILVTPYMHPLSIILDPAFFLIGHRHYSKTKISHLLNNSGFIVQKNVIAGGFFKMSLGIIKLIFKHILKSNFPDSNFVNGLIKNEYQSKFTFAQINVVAKKTK